MNLFLTGAISYHEYLWRGCRPSGGSGGRSARLTPRWRPPPSAALPPAGRGTPGTPWRGAGSETWCPRPRHQEAPRLRCGSRRRPGSGSGTVSACLRWAGWRGNFEQQSWFCVWSAEALLQSPSVAVHRNVWLALTCSGLRGARGRLPGPGPVVGQRIENNLILHTRLRLGPVTRGHHGHCCAPQVTSQWPV